MYLLSKINYIWLIYDLLKFNDVHNIYKRRDMKKKNTRMDKSDSKLNIDYYLVQEKLVLYIYIYIYIYIYYNKNNNLIISLSFNYIFIYIYKRI